MIKVKRSAGVKNFKGWWWWVGLEFLAFHIFCKICPKFSFSSKILISQFKISTNLKLIFAPIILRIHFKFLQIVYLIFFLNVDRIFITALKRPWTDFQERSKYFQNFFVVLLQFFSKIIWSFRTIFRKFFQKLLGKFH